MRQTKANYGTRLVLFILITIILVIAFLINIELLITAIINNDWSVVVLLIMLMFLSICGVIGFYYVLFNREVRLRQARKLTTKQSGIIR